MANHYDVPSWAGKPPTGLHLDVLKDDKLIQKLMLDEKRCYLFGRNPQMNDFCIDHASCSRVHAAFVYHKHLNKAFLVDLGSTHGTYIGQMRLEANKPTQLPIDFTFHFGASTRYYVIRERPTGNARGIMEDIPATDAEGALLGLPETQTELDNLTEFNTAHNRRISMLGISTEDSSDMKGSGGVSRTSVGNVTGQSGRKQKREVSFNEDVDIINPEDVDPTVGRFRNLVKTTIVPSAGHLGSKRLKLSTGEDIHSSVRLRDYTKHLHPSVMSSLYHELPAPQGSTPTTPTGGMGLATSMSLLGTRLGISLPNPAPDVDLYEDMELCDSANANATPGSNNAGNKPNENNGEVSQGSSNEPKKKKYAKEAWPGRKPSLLPGV
ncbi:nuclear inhibitor of protein phosphatase 1 [Arctopsyche grandis]|uniref:nuclear inhibitor of protein phosphatase 1 n=1 Tax=Arctopsyche grandis TaxID=121162 RepID=UPI00406D71CD